MTNKSTFFFKSSQSLALTLILSISEISFLDSLKFFLLQADSKASLFEGTIVLRLCILENKDSQPLTPNLLSIFFQKNALSQNKSHMFLARL